MHSLTLWRPWLWSIFHLPPGKAKRVENRTWPPPHWLVDHYLALHAGKTWDAEGAEFIEQVSGVRVPPPEAHPSGAIVGIARVTGFKRKVGEDDLFAGVRGPSDEPADPWFFGPYGWKLDRVLALPEPIPCRGAQGLWVPPPEVNEKLEALVLGGARGEKG